MKKLLALLLSAALLASVLCACAQKVKPKNPELDLETPVTLKIAGMWKECKAIDKIAGMFSERYPNVTVEYEFVQDYYESMPVRLSAAEDSEDKIDIFLTVNLQPDAELYSYALELTSQSEVCDLSGTFPGLIKNFSVKQTDGTETLYAVPLGADMRGIFVNKTLLDSLNIAVPTNLEELYAACDTLLENGYIPMQGNPSYFAQRLLYPYICNIIANADPSEALWEKVNTCEAGVSGYFEDAFRVIYTIMERGYYDYKTVEKTYNRYTDTTDEATARDFLDIAESGGGFEKQSDVGQVAFMPSSLAQIVLMEQTKEDYHSQIEYEFVLAPVGPQSGYAYMSPAQGIAVNKNSEHTDWALEFMNFLFTPENNRAFAEEFHCIANTADALGEIGTDYAVAGDCICELGQVTFDYGFYKLINESLIEVSKGNNPKYMDTDANGSSVLFSFEHYMSQLEESFAAQRENNAG